MIHHHSRLSKSFKKVLALLLVLPLMTSHVLAYSVTTPTVNAGDVLTNALWNRVVADLLGLNTVIEALVIKFENGNNAADAVFTGGNVGIGITSPTQKLDVNGNLNFTGSLYQNGSLYKSGKFIDGTDTNDAVYTDGNVGIGIAAPTEKLHVSSGIIYTDGEGSGLIVDAGVDKRVGFMKYSGREAGIWRTPAQDFEIGRTTTDLSDDGLSPVVDLYISENGNVGVGVTDPASPFTVGGNVSSSTATVRIQDDDTPSVKFVDTNNDDWWIHVNSDRMYFIVDDNDNGDWSGESPYPLYLNTNGAYAPAFVYTSDEQLKENIVNLQNAQDILNISPKKFDWKNRNGQYNETNDIGVIAQDVEKYFPQFVLTDDETGLKSVNYPKLVVPLISVVKDQQAELETLKREVEQLKSLITK